MNKSNECGCGRSVTGKCMGWHDLPEEKFLEKKGGNLGGDGGNLMFGGGRWERYAQTKLANAAFTACLHEKLQKNNSKIRAMVAHPGLAESDLQSTTVEDGGMGSFFTKYIMVV